ncbi:MAG: amidohydrolase family protein [Bacteroidota bacterium]
MKNKLNRYLIWVCSMLLANTLTAQVRVVPAPAQDKPILLQGATAHLGNGEVIEGSMIGFKDGKISLVANMATAVSVSEYEVVDVSGKHIYPGFILPTTELGLVEVSAVSATRDFSEQGQYNPNVRSIIAYNTDSELIPASRFNGILMAQTTPTGGTISGTSSVVQLDAWNWEDAAYKTDDAIHLNWPPKMFGPRWWLGETQGRPNPNYDQVIQELQGLFAEAKAYSSVDPEETNLKLAAMEGLFDGSKSLFVYTDKAKAMLASVRMAKENGVEKVVIVGGNEAMLVKDFLKEHEVAIVLTEIHRLPSEDHEDTRYPFKLPKELYDAGIPFCIGYDGISNARNLPFTVGTTVAHGMPYEEALKTITSNTAEILGISDQVGTLEKGKDATLIVSEGDVFDMRTSKLTHAFIQGRQIQLNARQQWLYEKYSKKYGHDID